ncbi:hypothetical protein EYR41_004142 [Orbilia oligospora]|uniref:Uncharacterized protein n=1 Tax=Orbilia oligospora TaxID=2813651 RepID=A0A7C8KD69_ORBOL|nr:hypothetical protein TWF751_007494 [Orbilia oligospora]TGJ72235.1 hypothetical protein EYR41_004142 [Orbilia oligospora]
MGSRAAIFYFQNQTPLEETESNLDIKVDISTACLSPYPAKLVDDDKLGATGNPKDVESLLDCHEALDSEEGPSKLKDLEGNTNSNTGPLETSGFLIHKRDVSDANSTATASLTVTTVPNTTSMLNGTSVSTPSLVPASLEASVSSTSLPTSDEVAADEGKGHISNISLRVDVPKSYFIQGRMVIECRSAEATYESSRNTEPRWALLDWPNFQEYPSKPHAIGSIKRRIRSCKDLSQGVHRGTGVRHACALRRTYPEECALVYGCYCNAQLHNNPDSITGASVADYQRALDGLPETIKNTNEGFRFNAGARAGGLDNWITFSEAARMYPIANRPMTGLLPLEIITEIPPPIIQEPPGYGLAADPFVYVDAADLERDDPEIDEAGFQNWFGPGNNNFNTPS